MTYKKVLLGLTLAVVIAGSAVTANVAFAQAEDPPTYPANQAFMARRSMRWMSEGVDGWLASELGDDMHEAMIAAFAVALELEPEDLEARLEAGELMIDIALDQGLTSDDVREIMEEVREDARAALLESGIELPAFRENMFNYFPFEGNEDCQMDEGSTRRGGRGMSVTNDRFSDR